MKTLLQVSEWEDGSLSFYSAPYPGIENYYELFSRFIPELKKAPYEAQMWIELFGGVLQMMDLGMSSYMTEPDYDDYYNVEEEPWSNQKDKPCTMPDSHREPDPPYNPEMDPEWQKRRIAISSGLKNWRQEKAEQKGIHNWEIIKHTVLAEIARKMPITREDLMSVRGIGDTTWNRYGAEILSVVRKSMDSASGDKPDGAGQ